MKTLPTDLIDFLQEIQFYNNKILSQYLPTEKIDFSKIKMNWGINVIPKKFHIDLNKNYETLDGKKVILYAIKLFNSNNHEVTYPVKGTILDNSSGKIKKINMIWTIDGRILVDEKEINNPYNIISIK